MTRMTVSPVVLLAFLGCAQAAYAQGVGFAGGMAIDPSQVYVGSYIQTAAFGGHVRLRPGIDGAFGSGVSEAIIDFAFLYEIPFGPASEWFAYQGTGPSVTIERINGQHDASGGFLGIFGVGNKNGFFFEVKVTGGAGPSLRFGVGYTVPFHKP